MLSSRRHLEGGPQAIYLRIEVGSPTEWLSIDLGIKPSRLLPLLVGHGTPAPQELGNLDLQGARKSQVHDLCGEPPGHRRFAQQIDCEVRRIVEQAEVRQLQYRDRQRVSS